MSTLAVSRSEDVATKKGRPGKPGGEGRHVRLRPSIVSKARMIAGDKGVAMGDLLSDLLEAPISREYARMVKRLEKKGGES